MKFLLFFIGVSCCIAGIILQKDANKKMQSKFCIISGVLIVFAFLFFECLGIKNGITGCSIVCAFLMVFVHFALKLKDFPPISNKLTVNILKWCVFFSLVTVSTKFMVNLGKLPTVSLENGVIKMDGSFGDDFKVSDIQSVDTLSVYPKIGYMRGGSSFFYTAVGNFDLENVDKTAKLCIYRYKPPFIIIRLNDNRVLLLNFFEQVKTIEFYKQLKDSSYLIDK